MLIWLCSGGVGCPGADGGSGGSIKIYVDEDKTHLLLATYIDVKGGKGGEAGEHGKPGAGGRGGKGEQGHRWKEPAGFQYRCTPDCAGKKGVTQPSGLSTLVRSADPRYELYPVRYCSPNFSQNGIS